MMQDKQKLSMGSFTVTSRGLTTRNISTAGFSVSTLGIGDQCSSISFQNASDFFMESLHPAKSWQAQMFTGFLRHSQSDQNHSLRGSTSFTIEMIVILLSQILHRKIKIISLPTNMILLNFLKEKESSHFCPLSSV